MTAAQEAKASLEDLLAIGENRLVFDRLLQQSLSDVGVIPFVGAGLSIPHGIPGWTDFLQSLCAGLAQASRSKVLDLLSAADYEGAASALETYLGATPFEVALEGRLRYSHRIEGKESAAAILPDVVPHGPVITTNFDNILSESFSNAKCPFVEECWGDRIGAFYSAIRAGKHYLIKIHGDYHLREGRVLTAKEYRQHYGGQSPTDIDPKLPLPTLLRTAYESRVLLFLGCSLMRDRTVRLFEDWASRNGTRWHVAILERPTDDQAAEIRARGLAQADILPLWYPAGQHAAVPTFLHALAQARQSLRRKGRSNSQMPPLPRFYVPRKDKVDSAIGLLSLAGDAPIVALAGGSGTGKTTVATAICLDERTKHNFPGGILWTVIGSRAGDRRSELAATLWDNINQLAGHHRVMSDDDPRVILDNLLSETRTLMVLDDVWKYEDLCCFIAPSIRSPVLLTTRNLGIAAEIRASRVEVGAFSVEQAIDLISQGLTGFLATHRELIELTAFRLFNSPLLVSLAGARLRELTAIENLEPLAALRAIGERLDRGVTALDRPSSDDRNKTLAASMEMTLELLGNMRTRFLELGIFPTRNPIPFDIVCKLWKRTGGLSHAKGLAAIDEAWRLSLFVSFDSATGTFALHDEVREYAKEMLGQERIKQLHQELLHAVKVVPWAELPATEKYLWHRLVYHMEGGGCRHELFDLLSDADWLARKIALTSVEHAIADLDQGGQNDDSLFQTLRQALVSNADGLRRHPGTLRTSVANFVLESLDAGLLDESTATRLLQQVVQGKPWLRQTFVRAWTPSPLLTTTGRGVRAVSFEGTNDESLRIEDADGWHVWQVAIGSGFGSIVSEGKNDQHRGVASAQRTGSPHPSTVFVNSPDGELVAVYEKKRLTPTVHLRSLRTGEELAWWWVSLCSPPMVVSSDGRFLFVCGNDGCINLWSAGKIGVIFAHRYDVEYILLNRKGTLLVSVDRKGDTKVWEIGRLAMTLMHGVGVKGGRDRHIAGREALSICPTKGWYATCGRKSADLNVWSLENNEHIATLSLPVRDPDRVDGIMVRFSEKGDLVAASTDDGLSVFRTSDWKVLWENGSSYHADFSPDGKYVALWDGWKSCTGTLHLTANGDTLCSFTTDAPIVAVEACQHTPGVLVLTKTGELHFFPAGPVDPPRCRLLRGPGRAIGISEDGNVAVVISGEDAYLVNIATLSNATEPARWAYGAAGLWYSERRQLMIAASPAGLTVLDWTNGREVASFASETPPVAIVVDWATLVVWLAEAGWDRKGPQVRRLELQNVDGDRLVGS